VIVAPKGFSFSAVPAGFKYKNRNDLVLLLSDRPATGAGVFTTNRFQAAPVLIAKESIDSLQPVRGILVNAGQANACTGEQGVENCRQTLEWVSGQVGCAPGELLPASTGVIGDQLKMDVWREAVPLLSRSMGRSTPMDAAKAIMTTDSFPKLAWRSVGEGRGVIRVLGMAKGAGMICPNMATMLAFVLCDAQVDPTWWRDCLARAAGVSFNAVSVDGDTSTNDCVLALANGASGVLVEGDLALQLAHAVEEVCRELAYFIVQDAEGGTKVVRISVEGAVSDCEAEQVARTVGHSPLVKTAMFGQDPNWGRIVAALGRSGAEFQPQRVEVLLAGIPIFGSGQPVEMDRDAVFAPFLRRGEIEVTIRLHAGKGRYELLTSDLTLDYVRINAEYRT
jgi:glutamate N-acetyltransferase / amino-acid N-acetyltransferase